MFSSWEQPSLLIKPNNDHPLCVLPRQIAKLTGQQNPVSTSPPVFRSGSVATCALFWQACAGWLPSWARPRPLRLLSQRPPIPFRALGLQTHAAALLQRAVAAHPRRAVKELDLSPHQTGGAVVLERRAPATDVCRCSPTFTCAAKQAQQAGFPFSVAITATRWPRSLR